jgi:hypothetical protein
MKTTIVRRIMLGLATLTALVGASAAPAAAAPAGYVSFRPHFSQQNALTLGFPQPTVIKAYDADFGFSDWRMENTINGFRLHNRFFEANGSDICLAGGGTAVWEEACATSPAKMSQNWSLASVSGGFRLRHAATAKFVTYPAFGTTGRVSLAASGALATQQFVFGL